MKVQKDTGKKLNSRELILLSSYSYPYHKQGEKQYLEIIQTKKYPMSQIKF